MWSLQGSQTNGSGVSIVKTCNIFNEPGLFNFIVVRDDGSVEIYSYEHKNPVPTLRFETKIDESITGVDVGHISSPTQQEILLTTYSGKVLTLIDHKNQKGGIT